MSSADDAHLPSTPGDPLDGGPLAGDAPVTTAGGRKPRAARHLKVKALGLGSTVKGANPTQGATRASARVLGRLRRAQREPKTFKQE